MHERIRELRKNYLKLSQEALGKRLGVSRSVIKNMELNVLARPDQKLSLIKLMCKEFSVNEEWLLNGVGPMFVQSDTFNLDDFAKSRGATALELDIIKAYFELEPDIRKMLMQHFKEHLTNKDDLNKSKKTFTADAEIACIKNHSATVQKSASCSRRHPKHK